MNWFFITLGTALVLILTAASVGPLFVDWTAYRSTIEANAERVLGLGVAVRGEADLRLLPSPRIRLTDVAIVGAGAPLVEADAVELDIDLAPLLRREVRVLDLRFEKPAVTLRLDEDGRLALPEVDPARPLGGFLDPGSIVVQSVAVEDMRLVVVDARTGARHAIEDVTMTGSARSLRGPFNASGTARIADAVHGLRIAGGAVEDDGTMALSVRLDPPREDVTLGFDGSVGLSAAAPRLVGRLTVEGGGEGAMPWTVDSDMAADTAIVTLDNAAIAYGPPEAPVELEGSAFYAFAGGEPPSIALEARQIDLDRMDRVLSGEEASADPAALVAADPVAPGEKVARLAAHAAPFLEGLAGAVGSGRAASATLDVGTVLSGGALVRDVTVAATARFGRIGIDRAEALLPGDTLVEASGRLDEAGFAGQIAARAAQPALLARWWTGGEAAGLVLDPILLDADATIAPDRVEARRLSVRIGESAARGRALWRAGDGRGAATVDVALAAPTVDVQDVLAGAAFLRLAGVSLAGTADVLVDVSVDRLRLAAVEAASLDIDATYREDTLTVDGISVEDLAGARVFASGVIGGLTATPVGTIEGSLEIVDGRPLAESLRLLLPDSAVAARIADALPALAPGTLGVSLSGRPAGEGRDLSLRASGTLAGTQVSVTATGAPFDEGWRDRSASLTVEAASANAAILAGQFGLPAAPGADLAAGAVDIDVSGIPAEGMAARARMSVGEDALTFDGEIAAGATPSLDGALSLELARLEALSPLVGRPLPAAGAVSLSADARSRADGALALSDLGGTVDGVPVSGALTVAADGASGTLAVDEMDARAIAALALGSGAWSGEGDRAWPDGALGEPLLPDLPFDLAVSVDRLDAGRWRIDNARFALSADGARLAVSDLAADLAGGTVSGGLRLARAGARADLGATLALEGAALSDLVWQHEGEPVASGRLTLSAEVVSSGFSVAGLVAGLSGTGSLLVENGVLHPLNPAPFDGLEAALDGDEPPREEEVSAAFVRHLDAAGLPFERLEASLDVAAGAVRVDSAALVAAAPLAVDTAILDLDRWRAEGDVSLPVPVPQDEAVRGADSAPPEGTASGEGTVEARIAFAGPLERPARSVDVSALVAWASLRQLERQVEAVERQNEELAAEAAAVDPAFERPDPATDAPSPPGVDAGADAPAASPATTRGPAGTGRQEPSELVPGLRQDADPSATTAAPRTAGAPGEEAGAGSEPLSTPVTADGVPVPVPEPSPAPAWRPSDSAAVPPAIRDGAGPGNADPVLLGSTGSPRGSASERASAGEPDPIGAFLRSTLPGADPGAAHETQGPDGTDPDRDASSGPAARERAPAHEAGDRQRAVP